MLTDQLSRQIRDLRKAKRLSQVELAKALGVSKQSVSNWENDNILPSIEMLVSLSEIFSVSTDYLLGLNKQEYVDVSGLSHDTIAHIQQIIDDLRRSSGA